MDKQADDEFRLVASASGGLAASGVLSFATATEAWGKLRSAIAGEQAPRQLDLAGIRHSDSAGLSCVLAIVAESVRDGHRLQVLHMPEGMRALAQVCEIDGLLV